MNHIKDIQLVFDEENLSKYGAFPLLAWFMIGDNYFSRLTTTIFTVFLKKINSLMSPPPLTIF